MKQSIRKLAALGLALCLSLPLHVSAEAYALPEAHRTEAVSPVFADPADAVFYVREQLKQRVPGFTVVLETESLKDQEGTALTGAITEMMHTVWAEAIAHTGDPDEGDFLRYQIGGFRGGFSYVPGEETVHIELAYEAVHYYMDPADDTTARQEISEILRSMDLEGRPDYVKARAIYNFICQRVAYDEARAADTDDFEKYTAAGAMTRNEAVCQGFAVLFYRMALEAGLKARVVAGTCNGEPHAWNLVRISGLWYNLDATLDAGKAPEDFTHFLKNDITFSADHSRYPEFEASAFRKACPMSPVNYL